MARYLFNPIGVSSSVTYSVGDAVDKLHNKTFGITDPDPTMWSAMIARLEQEQFHNRAGLLVMKILCDDPYTDFFDPSRNGGKLDDHDTIQRLKEVVMNIDEHTRKCFSEKIKKVIDKY